ncbi:MAG: HAD family hydrolase [Desulfobacterales bacterium]|nr:HAD family hydrolase [Desulfobacterales bacterium]
MKMPAVFMDRDGTINEQRGYINHISRFILLPGTAEAIRLLNSHQYLAIIVSNQSGVARGYFPLQLVEDVHSHMKELLKKENAVIDGIFFCPHYRTGVVSEYTADCDCRKPRTGLIKSACETFDIDMTNSYVIGDRCTDIELAKRADLEGILVKTGYGLGDIEYVLPGSPLKPAYIAGDLLDAVRWIIEKDDRQ